MLVEEGKLMCHPVTVEEDERRGAGAVRAYMCDLLDAAKSVRASLCEDALDRNRPKAWDTQQLLFARAIQFDWKEFRVVSGPHGFGIGLGGQVSTRIENQFVEGKTITPK